MEQDKTIHEEYNEIIDLLVENSESVYKIEVVPSVKNYIDSTANITRAIARLMRLRSKMWEERRAIEQTKKRK